MKEQIMKLRIGADRFIMNDKEVCKELKKKFQAFTIEQEGPKLRDYLTKHHWKRLRLPVGW